MNNTTRRPFLQTVSCVFLSEVKALDDDGSHPPWFQTDAESAITFLLPDPTAAHRALPKAIVPQALREHENARHIPAAPTIPRHEFPLPVAMPNAIPHARPPRDVLQKKQDSRHFFSCLRYERKTKKCCPAPRFLWVLPGENPLTSGEALDIIIC